MSSPFYRWAKDVSAEAISGRPMTAPTDANGLPPDRGRVKIPQFRTESGENMPTAVWNNSGAGLRWFHFSAPGGQSISCKGAWEGQARMEAAERLRCEPDELTCTGWEPYYKTYKLP